MNEQRGAFRCPVAPEKAGAQLKIGHKLHLVAVLDTSRDGFTLRADEGTASKLKDGGQYVLYFAGEIWEVRKESHYEDGGDILIGLRRLQEISKVKAPSSWNWFSYQRKVQSDPALLLYLMLMFLFACIALPGMGDSLGTAPRIKSGIHVVIDSISSLVR